MWRVRGVEGEGVQRTKGCGGYREGVWRVRGVEGRNKVKEKWERRGRTEE